MLSFIKKLIGKRADPADVASDEAHDLIKCYHRLEALERHEMISAFDYTKSQLEIEHGEIHTWQIGKKAGLANEILKIAKEVYEHAPCRASGIALLGLYLEAQTLSGEISKRVVALIKEWQRRALAERKSGSAPLN
jgi:hypothetical protein